MERWKGKNDNLFCAPQGILATIKILEVWGGRSNMKHFLNF